MVRILVTCDSITGHVERLAEVIAEGARSAPDTEVVLKKAGEVTDEDLVSADGIVFGSLKYYGSFGPGIGELFRRMYRMDHDFSHVVGAGFAGSTSAYGGQEHVVDNLIHGMLQAGRMIVVGNLSPESGFVGGYVVGEPDEMARRTAHALGERVARVAAIMRAARGEVGGD